MARMIPALVLLGAAGALAASAQGATSFSMKLVADNDFAVFSGTSTSVNHLLYQNNVSWGEQISNLSTLSFTLEPGDTTFYVLGIGGGGEENISGTVNDVDITAISVAMSSDVGPYLTDYAVQKNVGGSVDQGTFDALLADVQAGYPNLTWGSPSLSYGTVVWLAGASPKGAGYYLDPSTAHLFKFESTEVGVQPSVPEPAAMALVAGASCLALRRRRQDTKKAAVPA